MCGVCVRRRGFVMQVGLFDDDPPVKIKRPRVDRKAVEAIYAAYPRKVGKIAAKKAIENALAEVLAPWLLMRVKAFAASPAGQAGQFTPHPATWFNRGSFHDDEAEWNRSSVPENASRVRGPAGKYDGIGKSFGGPKGSAPAPHDGCGQGPRVD